MRTVPPALAAHLAEPVTTLATCWRLQRRDGVLVALTSHDRDLVIDDVVYHADGGLDAMAAEERGDLSVGNLEIAGILSGAGLPAQDLAEGRFDGARVDVFLVNWADPAGGTLLVRRGTLGPVTREDGVFRAELLGLSEALRQSVTEVYSATCRAELGDGRCQRSLASFERETVVSAVIDAFTIDVGGLSEPDGWYDFGRIRWHTGANGGLVSEVRQSTGARLALFQPPPNAVAAGDVLTLTAGCIKTLAICESKFDNVVNFRGDPFVPGNDAIIDYPG
ncbi:MAG: DUF2163 domain-containing protein, partial [Alphaproteobacteria bacterium]